MIHILWRLAAEAATNSFEPWTSFPSWLILQARDRRVTSDTPIVGTMFGTGNAVAMASGLFVRAFV